MRFGSCDVDANPGTAQLLGIRSIPTLDDDAVLRAWAGRGVSCARSLPPK